MGPLIGFILVLFLSILSLVLFFWGRQAARSNRKRLAQIEAVPLVYADEVAACAPGMAKMAGKVIAPDGALKSPIEEVACVYYRLLVEEERTETERVQTKDGPRTRTVKVWRPIHQSARMVVCGVRDKRGAIEVSLTEAEMLLREGAQQTTGLFRDISPRVRKLLEEEHDVETRDLLFSKKLRVSEEVLPEGEEVFVVGKVKLLKTARGVRPRFVRGKQPLLVTDKSDEELTSHYKGKARWGVVGMIAGAVFGVAAGAVLGVTLYGALAGGG